MTLFSTSHEFIRIIYIIYGAYITLIRFPDSVNLTTVLLLGLVACLSFLLIAGLSYRQLPKVTDVLMQRFFSAEVRDIYQHVVIPNGGRLSWTIAITIADIMILAIPTPRWMKLLEFPLGLLVAISISFLGFKLYKDLFERFLLGVALEDQTKINIELLTLGNFLARTVIVLIVIFLFAETHQINLIGLVASLGVAGAAIALASQKIIEQILWSVVLYIDKPFTVGDYIHLTDGTLGRVEAVGWRSSKVRLSGKNTLVIVPNSNLGQVNIENLTKAARGILIVELTFFRAMSDEEKALIHQLILASTSEILGIDHQLTQVTFQDLTDDKRQIQVHSQAIFFVLGAAESSMELRKNLLEIARGNIVERLHNYGITFKFEEKIVDITQPMNM